MDSIIRIENLTFEYKKGEETEPVRALDNVNLNIERGSLPDGLSGCCRYGFSDFGSKRLRFSYRIPALFVKLRSCSIQKVYIIKGKKSRERMQVGMYGRLNLSSAKIRLWSDHDSIPKVMDG